MNKTSLSHIKKAFRLKYQNGGTAEHLGIIAAVQRSNLYTPGHNNADIRKEWEKELNRIVVKYKKQQQREDVFFQDVVSLMEYMNQRFQNRFNNGKNGYDNEFRIAHAQKSLSVCLKHLWVRGELGKNEPPVCPIDGVVLKYANNYDPWTRVNSLDNTIVNGVSVNGYKTHLNIVKEKAKTEGYSSLPEWELRVWWQLTQKSKYGHKKGENDSSFKAKTVILQVYNGARSENIGRTFQVINNSETTPHDTSFVYIEYKGKKYRAKEKTYQNGDTLRGTSTVSKLISDNHWKPGQKIRCEFIVHSDGSHCYRILGLL